MVLNSSTVLLKVKCSSYVEKFIVRADDVKENAITSIKYTYYKSDGDLQGKIKVRLWRLLMRINPFYEVVAM